MRTLQRLIFAGWVLAICSVTKAETPTIHSRLPLQQDGPLTVSPWFVAAQPTASAQQNHYIYSSPPLFFYGLYGYCDYSYGYGFGWYAPFYSSPRSTTVIINNTYIHR